MNQDFMKTKPIFPLVLSMSLPMMLSMLINSLYNIIDSMFVARIGEDALTAVSLVYPLQTLVVSISVGFGVGINAAVAFFLGAGEKENADSRRHRGCFSACCTARFCLWADFCAFRIFCLCLLQMPESWTGEWNMLILSSAFPW